MATDLPILRGPSTALYPFTETYICNVGSSDSQAGQAIRWVKGPTLVQFTFGYNPMDVTNKDTLKSAFSTAKGQFKKDFEATTDTTYTNLSMDEDEFSATEERSTIYGARWTLTQVIAQNLSPGYSGGDYPLLASGNMSQRPYTQAKRYQTVASKTPSGAKHTFAEFGGGLANFPTGGLMGWTLDEPTLLDVDVNTKVAHFLANWGPCFPFHFTDEDSVSYGNIYYVAPTLTIVRSGINDSRITTSLIQMAA